MKKTVRHWIPATILLLGAVILCPTQAAASCGDYVMIGGGHIQQEQAGDFLAATHSHHDPAIPDCQGPACSNRSFPPAAPAPKIDVSIERWAIPSHSKPPLLPESDFLVADAHDLPCDGFGLSILRPPR